MQDVATNQLLRRLPIAQRVNALLFFGNTRLASPGVLEVDVSNPKDRPDNSATIWELSTATETALSYPEGQPRQSIKSIVLSPDRRPLATASTGGEQAHRLSHSGAASVNDVTFAAGRRIIAGTPAGALLRWDVDRPDLAAVLLAELELELIRKLTLAVDSAFLAVASGRDEVTILNAVLASAEPQFSAPGSVSARAFPGKAPWVTGGRDGSTQVWDWREGRSICDFQLHDNMIGNMAMAGAWLPRAGGVTRTFGSCRSRSG